MRGYASAEPRAPVELTEEQIADIAQQVGNTGTPGPKGDKGDPGAKGDPGNDATVTKVAVEAVLTGEISTHSHAGGMTQAQILIRQL